MKSPRIPPVGCSSRFIRSTLLVVSLLLSRLSRLGLLGGSLRIAGSLDLSLALGRSGLGGGSAVGSGYLALAILEGLLVLDQDALTQALAVDKFAIRNSTIPNEAT